jgi:hypothetical protein
VTPNPVAEEAMSEITSTDRRQGGGRSDLSATLKRMGQLEGPSLPETMLELGTTLAGLVAIMLGIFMAVSLIE